MSDNINQMRKRLKTLVNSGMEYNVVNGKRRRVCSVNMCDKQAQRKGLCARHLTENTNQQQSISNTAVSQQSSVYSMTEAPNIISNVLNNSATLTGNHTEQNTFYDGGEFVCFVNSTYIKTSFVCLII
jgi:hypothetical protein